MKTKYIIRIALVFTGAATILSCTSNTGQIPAGEQVAKPEPVKVMIVEYADISRSEELTAEIRAFEETNLAPALSGRISRIRVDVNDRVTDGQVLVEMDRTQLDQARVQYLSLKKDLARMDTLLRYGSVTQQVYDQQESAVEIQEVLLQNLEKNTVLKAPYAAIVTGRYYNEGELFSPAPNTPSGKAAILTLMQISKLKVIISLPEKYLPMMRQGLPADLNTDVYPAEVFEGKVLRIYPTIDAATRTFQAEVQVQNPALRLRPGMFARINLRLGTRKAMVVPAITILQQPGTNDRFVFIHRDGKAKKVFVKLGERYDDLLEIISGELKGGEELIWAGQKRLEDQTPVVVLREEKD